MTNNSDGSISVWYDTNVCQWNTSMCPPEIIPEVYDNSGGGGGGGSTGATGSSGSNGANGVNGVAGVNGVNGVSG